MPNMVRFDCFEVDLESCRLQKRGIRLKLRDQSFKVLASLLLHPGRVVTREELRRQLWHDQVFVDFENNLNTAVARLREVLGDSAEHPRFIETLPKHGYRFIGNVSPPRSAESTVRSPRLVVLPFLNLSGDPAHEYYSDALTDEIIADLASVAPGALAVIARTTAMHYKGTHKDVAHIGRELGVDYVVEGAARRDGNQVAFNVQVIRVTDQTHVFAKKYKASLRDFFDIQKGAAREIAESIGVTRGGIVAPPATRKLTYDLTAYSEYIQGRYYMAKANPEGFAKAKPYFDSAIARDPDFALPYDALAELYWYLGYFGFMPPQKAFSAGIVHALRALEIDNTRAETHALLGQFHKSVEYNWREVQREMALARQLDPASPLVRMRYAVSGLMPHGRVEEAAAELEHALEVDPLSTPARSWLGIMLVLSRRYERGIDESRKLLDLDPAAFGGYFVLARCCRYKKMFDEAISAQRKAVEVSNNAAAMLGWLGLTLAEGGQFNEAREVLQRLHRMAEDAFVPPSSFAWIHLGLKEIDTAFEWLNRAVDACDQFMMPIKSYAFFDPIRSDPRFATLLHKMNLEP